MLQGLLTLSALAGALAAPASSGNWAGANYFQTNSFENNSVISSYINADGTLTPSQATWTSGKGLASINDPAPLEEHADPFLGSQSVIVKNNWLYAVNAGSDTFSMFAIDESDPTKLTLKSVTNSGGEFPTSLAANAKGDMLCVLNSGAVNGVRCFSVDSGSLNFIGESKLGLNLTTPPHGPVGGTPSQMLFTPDDTLIVAVKGSLPTDLNNPHPGTAKPGYFSTYTVSWSTGMMHVADSPAPGGFPFSITQDLDNSKHYFASDVGSGFDLMSWEGSGKLSGSVGKIQGQGATCWSVQSPKTKSYYVTDTDDAIGFGRVYELTWDGQMLANTTIGNMTLPTDLAIATGSSGYDYLYVNVPPYEAVWTYKIMAPGRMERIQALYYGSSQTKAKLGTSVPQGFAGQAVYMM